MINIKEFIANYSDNELQQCFNEIKQYEQTGILQEKTRIRELNREYNELNDFSVYWDNNCRVTCEAILFELAKRYVTRLEHL